MPSLLLRIASVYESWPAATGPQPVAKPIVKKTGEEGKEVEVEEDEGDATPEGNKRLLADILSVRLGKEY